MTDVNHIASKYKLAKIALAKKIGLIKLLYAVSLFAVIVGIFVISKDHFTDDGNNLKNSYSQRDTIVEQAIKAADTSKISQLQKLRKQYLIIKEIKKPYIDMVQKFDSYNYAFTLTFTITSIITAILAFLLVKKGWDNINDYYLKVSFMTFFFASTLLGVLPNVFNNKENAKNNFSKYSYYSELQFEIFDLISDNKGLIKNNKTDILDSLISNINVKIISNQDLYIDIYIEKVPQDIKPLPNN